MTVWKSRWICLALLLFGASSTWAAEDSKSTPVVIVLHADEEYGPEISRFADEVAPVLERQLQRKIVFVERAGAACMPANDCAARLAARHRASEILRIRLHRVDSVRLAQAEVYGEDGGLQMRAERPWGELFGPETPPRALEAWLVQTLKPSEYIGYLRLQGVREEMQISVDGIVYSAAERSTAVPVSVGRHLVGWRNLDGSTGQEEVEILFQEESRVELGRSSHSKRFTGAAISGGATLVSGVLGLVYLGDILISSARYQTTGMETADDLKINQANSPHARAYGNTFVARRVAPVGRGVQASQAIMWTSFSVATLTGAVTAVLLTASAFGDDVE